MRHIVWIVGLLAAGAVSVITPAEAQVGARIWMDGQPDYFRRGDRMTVNFSVSDDSYVAVVHIDTEGRLDFVFPTSPLDNEYVRGGIVQRISPRGSVGSWTVRGRPGIGYFYILASPDPLDFSYFRSRAGASWDWAYAGQFVRGDPFLAFDQIARLLMPWSPYPRYVFDYYSYYVEGIHRYPSYACSSSYSSGYGWGYTPAYGACSNLDYFLRDYPYYYDTRRYRGDRRSYLRQYERLDPRHGFKESPDRPARGIRAGDPRPAEGTGQIPRRPPVTADPAPQARPQNQGRAPAQGRPSTTRSPSPSTGVRERPSPSGGERRPAAEPSSGRAPSGGGESRPAARGRPSL